MERNPDEAELQQRIAWAEELKRLEADLAKGQHESRAQEPYRWPRAESLLEMNQKLVARGRES